MTAQPTTTASRNTGICYLGIVLCGLFAELVVRGSLLVPGDAGATAQHIAEAPGFFALGVAADALMVALDVAVAFGLYRLLRDVDRRLAIAATAARLIQAAIIALNLLHPLAALSLATSGDAGVAPRVLEAMQRHALFYDVGLIAFGIACLLLGRLFQRADAPRWLAAGLALTGVIYLVGSFAAVFAPTLLPMIDPLYAIAIIVEPAVAIWLIASAPGAALEATAVAG